MLAQKQIEKSTQVYGAVEEITPKLARLWLSKTKSNKRSNKRTVTSYAADMSKGLWKMNGEPIIFTVDETLLAGKHRLNACIQANTSFNALVVRNVPEDAFESLDTLRRRTVGDILTIRKLPSGRALASALTTIWRFMYDDLGTGSKRPPIQEMLEILETFPALKDSTDNNSSIIKARNVAFALPLGLAIAYHFIFSLADTEKANDFYNQVFNYENEAPNSPGAVLAKTLLQLRDNKGRRDPKSVNAFIIKAWNAFYSGTEISFLRFNKDKEKFPSILGVKNKPLNRTSNLEDALEIKPQSIKDNFDHVFTRYELLTPQKAKEILTKHPVNRRAAEAVIERYGRDMKAGKWKLNGQTVKISSAGNLIDGQHRLKACITSGCSFPTLIVHGIDEAAFDTFDLGSKKGYHTILSERGEIQSTTLAAAVKWVWLYRNDSLRSRHIQPTLAELDSVLEAYPEIRNGLSNINKLRDFMPPSTGVFLQFACAEKSASDSKRFFSDIGEGLGLAREDAAYVLRQKLIKEKRKARRVSASDIERIVWIIKAWNAFREKNTIKTLAWRTEGASKEPIPAIV